MKDLINKLTENTGDRQLSIVGAAQDILTNLHALQVALDELSQINLGARAEIDDIGEPSGEETTGHHAIIGHINAIRGAALEILKANRTAPKPNLVDLGNEPPDHPGNAEGGPGRDAVFGPR